MVLNVRRHHKTYWGLGEGRMWYGVGEEGDYIPITVTTRMTSALRWAAMKAILMFRNCEGQSDKTVSTDHNF